MGRPARVTVGDVVLGGKYRVERFLGEGGMGVVVLARHIDLGQAVAIKVLRDDSDDAVVKRFMREARSAVQLSGDHVVRVHDVGRLENGAPYMLMEYLEGEDLGAVVARGALAIGDAADYVLQACEGIAEAHALGIVHRDLKPQNLFLARRAHHEPVVKVLDFGIAKSFQGMDDVSLTATHAIMGSPAYMSPEQMRASRDVDSRTDVWSLGIVLFELLSGAAPFEGHTVADLCARVLMQEPVPIDQRRADVPRALQDVLARCMAKDVSERLSSVGDLAVALEPYAPASARGTASRILRQLEGRPDAPAQSSERTLPDREGASVAPAVALLPTLVAAGNDVPHAAHVRTAATFESLGPSFAARELPRGKLVALGAVVVALAIALVFALARPSSHDRDATAEAPPGGRPATGSIAIAPGVASAPASVPPISISIAAPADSAPGPAREPAGSDASFDAATGSKPAATARKPAVARPATASPRADAGSKNSQFF